MVGNSRFQKKANRALILNYLYKQGPHPRNQLARELGLQPSTVTYIIQGLLKEGMVLEEPMIDSNARTNRGSGRKPVIIGLSPQYGCVVGLDLQVDYYVTVIYDLAGNLILSRKEIYKKKEKEKDFTVLLERTVRQIDKFIRVPILGLGLALPGIINSHTSTIIDCWTHNLSDQDLSSWLGTTFTFPVIVENDANCAALNLLSQMNSQSWEDSEKSFIYLLPRFHNPVLVPENQPSVGIGMGLVFNGKLYRGAKFQAGEYQSILSHQSGLISRQLSLSNEELSQAFENEKTQKAIVSEVMDSMALLFQILDPRILIIGRDLAGKEKEIRVLGRKKRFPYPMEIRENDSFDPAQGACALIFEQLFSIPQVGTENEEVK